MGYFSESLLSEENRMTESDFLNAIKEACSRAGTQAALALQAGIAQGRISDYLNKRREIFNMSLGTLLKLFPEMQIRFFRDEEAASSKPKSLFKIGTIEVGGANHGIILRNAKGNVTQNHGAMQTGESVRHEDGDGLDPAVLAKKLRKDERFTAEEKIKFLDFLDEQI